MKAFLTDKVVEAFHSSSEKPAILWDTQLIGFAVMHLPSGNRRTYSFRCRVKSTRKERVIKLGRHLDPLTCEEARTKALSLKKLFLEGIDPRQKERLDKEEQERVKGFTLQQVMEHYIKHKRTKNGPLRERTKEDIRAHMERNLVDWCAVPIASITTAMCMARATSLHLNKSMVYLKVLHNYAKEKLNLCLGDNPVNFQLSYYQPRSRRIKLVDTKKVWFSLYAVSMSSRVERIRIVADWVRFVMLTGCRLTESGSLKWSDVDFNAKTITLRAEIVKNHTELVLPMSEAVYQLLLERRERKRPRNKNSMIFVFWSRNKQGYVRSAGSALRIVERVIGYHVSLSDFRRTFTDASIALKYDIDARMELLNQRNRDTHMEHYANRCPRDDMRIAVESIAALLS